MGNIIYLGSAKPSSGSGGGGSITVDQTYDATSTNAQSGTAVAEALTTIPAFVGADGDSDGQAGLVPAPEARDYYKYLKGDGTWDIIPVDRSYDPTSLNAQSGEAVAEALATIPAFTGATSQAAGSAGLVPAPTTGDVDKYLKGDGTWGTVSGGGGLQNTATGNDSLTILGTPNTTSESINIGKDSSVTYDPSMEMYGGIAIGTRAASHDYAVAVGYQAITDDSGVAIGGYAEADKLSVAIGYTARTTYRDSIAIGYYAESEYDTSIALGKEAVASTDYSFDVGFGSSYQYQLLDGTTGKIPNDRINGVSGSFTTADGKTVTVTNGVITSIV